mmetsp:Transcript_4753/g.7168  ORF Transcript_4753/g.7168 Transcript_4753/m.7168 type:complete len:361 (+) Transcript_4753:3338-4420(+)
MFVTRYAQAERNIEATKRMDAITLKNNQGYDPLYGAITMTFFPINFVLLPFAPLILLLKSERINDFVLKVQYFVLIVGYAALGLVTSGFLAPLLYLKSVYNAGYLVRANKRERYRGENLVGLAVAIFLGPVIIVLSLLTDLCVLNVVLLRSEKYFEYKYPQVDHLAGLDKLAITRALALAFLANESGQHKGKTEYDLMLMHHHIFKMFENLHDFFCRGSATFKQFESLLRMFNLTKTLASQSSIPNGEGKKKENFIDFGILGNIVADAILYNYYYENIISHSQKKSIPLQEVQVMSKPFKYLDQKRFNTLPSLLRNYCDLFNIFAVNPVVRSFTDVEDDIKTYIEETDFYNRKKQVIKLE